jgi:hypothetical protein
VTGCDWPSAKPYKRLESVQMNLAAMNIGTKSVIRAASYVKGDRFDRAEARVAGNLPILAATARKLQAAAGCWR